MCKPIVHMDRGNPVFRNLVSGWRCFEYTVLAFSRGQPICVLCVLMTPSPFNLLTPQRLTTTTTTTTADYMLVFVLQKMLSLVVECESQQQFDLIISPHKRFWFSSTGHFCRLLLLLSVCIQRRSFMSRLQWIQLDSKILEMMPTGGKECVGTCGHVLSMNNVSCVFTSLFCCRPVSALTLKGHSLRPGYTSNSHAAKIRNSFFFLCC